MRLQKQRGFVVKFAEIKVKPKSIIKGVSKIAAQLKKIPFIGKHFMSQSDSHWMKG